MKAWRLIFVAHAVTALFLGAVAYVLLKDNTYIHVFLRRFFELPSIPLGNSLMVSLLRRFLADALWAYAMTFALSIIEKETVAFVITSATGVVWELCQRLHLVSGNFEVLDIATYICASGLAFVIIRRIKRKEKVYQWKLKKQ